MLLFDVVSVSCGWDCGLDSDDVFVCRCLKGKMLLGDAFILRSLSFFFAGACVCGCVVLGSFLLTKTNNGNNRLF